MGLSRGLGGEDACVGDEMENDDKRGDEGDDSGDEEYCMSSSTPSLSHIGHLTAFGDCPVASAAALYFFLRSSF